MNLDHNERCKQTIKVKGEGVLRTMLHQNMKGYFERYYVSGYKEDKVHLLYGNLKPLLYLSFSSYK